MRILIITQYYPPETGGTPNRMHSMALGLRDAGHTVTVIAPKPNHPEGIVWLDYREGFIRFSDSEGIKVAHCSVSTSPKKTFLTRLAFYFSFVVVSILAAVRLRTQWDIVLGTSPPLFVGIAAWIISVLKRCRFIFDVRDLWPDVAIALGALRNPLLIRLSRALERFLYERADGITAVTASFCTHIREIVADKRPVELVMNGTVPETFGLQDSWASSRRKLSSDGRFIVLFSGNLGLAQGLGHILDAAAALSNAHPDVRFDFLGSGPLKEKLVADAAQRRLSNIKFLPRTTLAEAALQMAAADALLVSLGAHPIYRMFIPSKLFDCMASGRPVLLSVDGEARTILEAADAGIYYPAEDSAALAEAVIALKKAPSAAARMGKNGRKYAAAHYSRSMQARIMAHFLEKVSQGCRKGTNAHS